ncbi:unnamed protein product [Triticum turgidum subsp. durum]|uniref:Uncharacterized protein n=1 Tax=Triticum turgidum subsp. durum TaxID=4567 RepID=A0A9R0TGW2_TRITD|nr:unnamed protein product [Triticum turgidum subsp. durum]
MEVAGMEFLLDTVDRFPLLEEFTDSVEQPDPVPLARMEANEPSYAGSAVSKDDSGCAQQIGEVEVDRNAPAARGRAATSPTRSAQSTGRVNPEAPGWTKRLRLGSAPPDRTPCPSRMSALEESMRKYAEEPRKNVVQPSLGLTFDSVGEAYDFYNLYSWETVSALDMERAGLTLRGQSVCKKLCAVARGSQKQKIVGPVGVSVLL